MLFVGVACQRCRRREEDGLLARRVQQGSTMALISASTKSKLFAMGVLCPLMGLTWSGVAAAGGSNTLTYQGHKGDGFARVVKSGNKDIVQVMVAPTVTARMECRQDGRRVDHIGGQLYSKNATDRTRTWRLNAEQLPSAAQLGAVCRQGHAAAMLPVKIQAKCRPVKTAFVVTGYHEKKPKIPFEVDCRGYGTKAREALVRYWSQKNKDHVVVRSSDREWIEKLGYVRQGVVGQLRLKPGPGATNQVARIGFKWNASKKKAQWAFVANELVWNFLKTSGWTFPRQLGYVHHNPGGGRIGLDVYFSPKTGDFTVAAQPRMVQSLLGAGYRHIGIAGYVEPIRP